MDYFFSYLLESGIFGQIGDVAVHFAIYLDIFYYYFAIGFQSAIEVVQVFDTRYFTGRSIE